MAVTDDFNRATLGANWTTPGIPGTPTYWGGSVEIMASPYGAAQPESAAIAGGDYCVALYTGDGEFSTNQYAELELVGDLDFESYTAVYNDYGSVGLLLNAPDPAGAAGTINTTLLRMHAFNYSPYGSYYYDKHLYVDLVSYVGGVALENREWIEPPGGQFIWDYNEFFTDLRIPSGTKVALQRRNNIYTVHLYSPDTSQWYKLFDAESDRGGSGGYPGIYVTSFNGQENARITNFRAGGDGDVFPDGSPGVAGGLSRTISRSTTRDIESSTNAKIRNLGSGGSDGAPVLYFDGANFASIVDVGAIGPPAAMPASAFANGDGILIIGAWDNLAGTGSQISGLSDDVDGTTGWTEVLSVGNTTSDAQIGVYFKVASGGESAITYSDAAYGGDTILLTLRIPAGTFTTTDTVGTALANEGTGFTVPGITTTKDNCTVVAIVSTDGGDKIPYTDATPSSPWTYAYNDRTLTNGGGVGCAIYTQELLTAGDSGDLVLTGTVYDGQVGVMFAIANG